MSINHFVGDVKQYRMVSKQASSMIFTPSQQKPSFPCLNLRFLGSEMPHIMSVFVVVWARQNVSK